ncbi:uncharacterized protein PHALS_11251 [Plasmopara halstedii]|uniref:Uncharacterized protein n=1 Tax=Plasmopara halstedii TaxID=4781 RepID=A0A0P1AJT9_PLAHL|nr:uncharacterized protein PHALS_11251 [Plasmopara halstedii]CEG41082.1 hypothetical protein PHALS_11251 [Plasmopara halstedii]|eukprot:XP_024577451.1 hypothetical protein PHALS_11251 [Plasmopara halstedii]
MAGVKPCERSSLWSFESKRVVDLFVKPWTLCICCDLFRVMPMDMNTLLSLFLTKRCPKELLSLRQRARILLSTLTQHWLSPIRFYAVQSCVSIHSDTLPAKTYPLSAEHTFYTMYKPGRFND